MNPFLTFLVVVPWIVSLILVFGLLLAVVKEGFPLGLDVVLMFVAGLSVYLTLLLKRTTSAKGSLLVFPGSDTVGEATKKSQTNLVLFYTYVALGILASLIFSYEAMRGWPGILAVVMGMVLLWSGIQVAISKVPAGKLEFSQLMITRSFYPKRTVATVIGAATIGAITVWLYRYSDSWKDASVWDVAGFLFFLVSACFWVILYDWKVQRRIDFYSTFMGKDSK